MKFVNLNNGSYMKILIFLIIIINNLILYLDGMCESDCF